MQILTVSLNKMDIKLLSILIFAPQF